MKLYPIFLKGEGAKALVVGGGKIAYAKTKQLLSAGFSVTVIAPELFHKFKTLSGKLTTREREIKPKDLRKYFIVIAATDNPEINKLIKTRYSSAKTLVNIVDKPELCNFYAPAIIKRGDLYIAISTAGASPAFAKQLRKNLQRLLPNQQTISKVLKKLKILRTLAIKKMPFESRTKYLKKLIDYKTINSLFSNSSSKAIKKLDDEVKILRGLR